MKTKVCSIIVLVSFIAAGAACAQGPEGLMFKAGGSGIHEDTRPDVYTQFVEQNSPALAEYNRKLKNIQTQVQEIINDYHENKIPKNTAQNKLADLARQELAIVDSPDFRVLSKVMMAMFAASQ